MKHRVYTVTESADSIAFGEFWRLNFCLPDLNALFLYDCSHLDITKEQDNREDQN